MFTLHRFYDFYMQISCCLTGAVDHPLPVSYITLIAPVQIFRHQTYLSRSTTFLLRNTILCILLNCYFNYTQNPFKISFWFWYLDTEQINNTITRIFPAKQIVKLQSISNSEPATNPIITSELVCFSTGQKCAERHVVLAGLFIPRLKNAQNVSD